MIGIPLFENREIGKSTISKDMFNIIRLLLLGTEENENVAGLLYGLTKEKKVGSYLIADLIFGAFQESSSALIIVTHDEILANRCDQKIELLDASLNSCSIEGPAWQLKAESLTILETGRNAVVKGVKLKIKGIPVLYIPYLRTAVGKDKFVTVP